jgi:multiple antibiotic resistance protein
MIFGESKPDQEVKLAKSGSETAIFPLAVPSLAGPGAMLTAVLLTENDRFTLWEQTQVTVVLLSVLLVAFVFMLAASFVHRVIGNGGASIIGRVMGLILASIAVSSVLAGIKEYFSL